MADLRPDRGWTDPDTLVRVGDQRWLVWCPRDRDAPVEFTAGHLTGAAEIAHALRVVAAELDVIAELEELTEGTDL